MADNTTINVGSGGDIVRDKDRAGVKTQIVALDLNPAGAETLMAGSLPVTSADVKPTGSITAANANLATGVATAGSTVVSTALDGKATLAVQVSGTWVGTLVVQVSLDNTNWVTLGGTPLVNVNTGVYSATIASAAVGIWQASVAGFQFARVTASAWTSGTAVVTMGATSATGLVALDAPLPAGAAALGTVGVTSLPALVTGTNVIGGVSIAAGTAASDTLSSAATTNATSVKTSSGNLYAVTASNVGAAAAFVKIYNKASAPTVGTDVPVLTIPIAASGVVSIEFGTVGIRLGTGIAFAITNLVADSDTTAIAAAQVKVLIAYT